MALSTRSVRSSQPRKTAAQKPKKKPNHIEDTHQQYIFDFMDMAYFRYHDGTLMKVTDFLFAIPNGGKRDAREAARLKRQGVKAGVSDMFLPVPMHDRFGLWIELKVGKGKPSEDQEKWINRMVEVGYLAMVIWGWKSAVEAIDAYLGGLYTKAGIKLTLDGIK
ncbi:MAG: VRR-NUC domain-containing protein [Gammaproteobacteria bacterium]|nr:VRR-NUC domain-containing protein [Gammaproteobacteria bacterium]